MNRYGKFDEARREYVITRPDTPAPWVNYLMGRDLYAIVSQTAGGLAFYKEPAEGRLTRYRFNGLPVDSPGFYLYIQDGRTTWSPSFRPVCAPLDRFECRHGLGYTRFDSESHGVRAEMTYLIPPDDNVFLWSIRLTNTSSEPRRLKITTYVEFSLHGFMKDTLAYSVCGNQWRLWFDKRLNGIRSKYFAFEGIFHGQCIFASNRPVRAFDVDRDRFIGPGRTEVNPLGIEKGLGNSEVPDGGRHACGALQNVVTLKPGETRHVLYRYAVSERFSKSEGILKRYRTEADVDRALERIRLLWDTALAASQVRTPDAGLNALLNTWFPYNGRVTFKLSRSISTRHTGAGEAMRFRDSMQDAMLAVTFFPREARAKILKLYRTMLASGKTVTGVNPETMLTTDTEWTRIDGALWGVFTVYRYLAETGDYPMLDEIVPYYDKGTGTILDHLLRGMRFIGGHDGGQGLPKIFNVDWNDMLVLFSRAYRDVQSVMVAEQFIYAARLLLEILNAVRRPTAGRWLEQKVHDYTSVLNSRTCWDGRWFKRLLMHDMVMGSHSSREGKIFLNTQSWAAIAGTLDSAKTRQGMDSAREHLATKYGFRLFAPAFTKMLDNRTPFDCNTPGAGENGGIFLHANTWAVMAEALLGNAERAWEYYRSILPCVLSRQNPDRYANEPYAFSSWIYGPDHERFGAGQLSWLTGGASWMHTVGMEYILGVRPTLNGIVFAPRTPANWKTYSVRRQLRNCLYEIEVRNPKGLVPTGVQVVADGKVIAGDVLPWSDKNSCRVTVTIA